MYGSTVWTYTCISSCTYTGNENGNAVVHIDFDESVDHDDSVEPVGHDSIEPVGHDDSVEHDDSEHNDSVEHDEEFQGMHEYIVY